jgi:hypothetical protein
MKHYSFVFALICASLVSCDQAFDASEVGVGGEGYVSGPPELGGIVSATPDKTLYQAMEESGDVPIPGSFYEQPWFALVSGDRVRLLEVDVDQGIGRVEVLTGFSAGKTGWLSLFFVKRD